MNFFLRDWITSLALALFVCASLLIGWSVISYFSISDVIISPKPKLEVIPLPKGSFDQPQEAKEALSGSFLNLDYSPMALQLPDLKRFFIYSGKNSRPDADPAKQVYHFNLVGSKESAAIRVGEPLYLLYDKEQPTIKYVFSADNKPTSLWVQATPKEEGVEVRVFMRNDKGEIIQEPESNASFVLTEKPFARFQMTQDVKVGKFKADSTLLSRQKARWYGQDKFLQEHGGVEFADLASRERIDFEDEEESYSVYVAPSDVLIFKDNQWVRTAPSAATEEYPMMQVKQVEDRLMRLDLWDVGGGTKVSLNLIKSTAGWNPKAVEKEFKFVGAKTRSQFVFEVGDERIVLSPKDWYLQTTDGWIKLTTPKEIDDYVDGKISGILLVFNGVERKEGRQLIDATLYSPKKNQSEPLEIPVMQGGMPVPYVSESKDRKKEEKKKPPENKESKRQILEEKFKELFEDGEENGNIQFEEDNE